ncbi:ATP synthase subunit g, mitochondrial-like [Echinops telfairi]|uniref:ATP synthase subunit g, mitochondrial-like n=1 Tax=Echinops telfairi TaxID=9371 RepID=A0AC55DRV6_ECHTE|nr:ATP synthase subunit g, mitochondrial-like [Echinops telfairi]
MGGEGIFDPCSVAIGSQRRTLAQFILNLLEKALAMVNTPVTYLKPLVATFWHYAKGELVPLTPAEISTAIRSLTKTAIPAQTGPLTQLIVKEALLNGLVATDMWMWFYIGEIIGKQVIIGCDV